MKKGQSLIEIITAIGLAFVILPGLITAFVASREGKAQRNQRLEAVAFLKEAQEAVRSVRENDWSSFAVDGTYHPVISGSRWVLTSGEEIINGFTRKIEISSISRDENGNIVGSSGTPDPSTKKVVVTVSWGTPYLSSATATSYLTRYLDNDTWIETLETEFNAGNVNGVVVTNTDGGEVTLGGGGQGDWCEPELTIATLDLPKNGVANAVSAIEGKAFAGTGDNASGVSYASVNIANTNPPTATIDSTFDGYKTNDVFGEENYAYLATDTNSKEIVIVNIASTPYSEAGHFNSSGSTDGESIRVVGNVGYMTAGSTFYTFDLSSKSGSRPELGSVALSGTGKRISVVGNYAYVAENGGREMEIIDVSNSSSPSIVGYADVDATGGGKAIHINPSGSRAFLATGNSSTQNELFIINISAKTGSRPILGSYNTNGMDPKGVTAVTNNKAIIVGSGGEEYQVVDLTNVANITKCGALQVDTGINGVSSVLEADGDAYSYIITGDASSEFKVIEGGPGGVSSTTGTFTSSLFDPGSSVTFNRFTSTITKPDQTDLKIQVGGADPVSGSCGGATFTFVGPDKTSGTYFTSSDDAIIAGQVPLDDDGAGYENPARCFKYKVFFDTDDITQSSILYDIAFNYSP